MSNQLQFTGKAYLTLAEAAEIVRSSKVTLRRAIKDRRLTASKPNGKFGKTLIRPAALSRYMERNQRVAIGDFTDTPPDQKQ